MSLVGAVGGVREHTPPPESQISVEWQVSVKGAVVPSVCVTRVDVSIIVHIGGIH